MGAEPALLSPPCDGGLRLAPDCESMAIPHLTTRMNRASSAGSIGWEIAGGFDHLKAPAQLYQPSRPRFAS
jgi:hypothetical protein